MNFKIWMAVMPLKYYFFFTFFYTSRFRANFRFPVLDGFKRFVMSWKRFDYFWKMSDCLVICLRVCLCVCDINFVASVIRELMNRTSWNFIFRITATWISVYQLLLEIVQQMALQSNIFQMFWDEQISASLRWNRTNIYIQDMYY